MNKIPSTANFFRGSISSSVSSISFQSKCATTNLNLFHFTGSTIKPNKPCCNGCGEKKKCEGVVNESLYRAHSHAEYGVDECSTDSEGNFHFILPEPKLKPECCYLFKFDALKRKIACLERNIQEITIKKEKAEQNRASYESEYTTIVITLHETKKEKAALELQLKEIEARIKKAKYLIWEQECKCFCVFGKLACATKQSETEGTNLDIQTYQMKATKNEFALMCYQHKNVCKRCKEARLQVSGFLASPSETTCESLPSDRVAIVNNQDPDF